MTKFLKSPSFRACKILKRTFVIIGLDPIILPDNTGGRQNFYPILVFQNTFKNSKFFLFSKSDSETRCGMTRFFEILSAFQIFQFSFSYSPRTILAAATRFLRLSIVSLLPRVFKPQSGFIQSFSVAIFSFIFSTALTISSTEGTRGE